MKEIHSSKEFSETCKNACKERSKKTNWRKNVTESNRRRGKPVAQIDKISGEIIKIWDCISDASRELEIRGSHICSCCNGKLKSHAGYKWKYAS